MILNIILWKIMVLPPDKVFICHSVLEMNQKITSNLIFADNESYKIMPPISYMYAGRVMPHWISIYNSLIKE